MGFSEQYYRVKRYLKRLEGSEGTQVDFNDNMWSFFQNCYHLKDWIINDPSIDKTKIDPGVFINQNEELRICSSLANRTKHSELDNRFRNSGRNVDNPIIAGQGVTIRPGPVGGVSEPTIYHTRILLSDGSEREALDVAKKAVIAWEEYFKQNGLKLEKEKPFYGTIG